MFWLISQNGFTTVQLDNCDYIHLFEPQNKSYWKWVLAVGCNGESLNVAEFKAKDSDLAKGTYKTLLKMLCNKEQSYNVIPIGAIVKKVKDNLDV